ncbi:MAG: N-acetylmuramic acid 6-phosphate etherase [Chloroflexi bacterium AL-W]|nr:N-acetylmuramic acid 6-phosphate etherase [Chloroflexi bacterium AL-W]
MLTEQPNPKTAHIDQLNTLEIVQLINSEDQLVAHAVAEVLPQVARAVEAIATRLKRGGRLIYSGAGTSGRLGVLDAVECIPTFSAPPGMIIGLIAGGDKALTQAVENAEDNQQAGKDDLAALNLTASDVVVGIAASGRTPYVLGAIDYARQMSALTVGVSCNVPAPLLDVVEIPIGVPVGAEVISGSTRMKSGTAQKMILNMISTAVMIKIGKVYGNLMVDVQVTNEKLARRARQLVMKITDVDEPTATTLLQESGNRVKVAIVMFKQGITASQAQAALADVDGDLRQLIG